MKKQLTEEEIKAIKAEKQKKIDSKKLIKK